MLENVNWLAPAELACLLPGETPTSESFEQGPKCAGEAYWRLDDAVEWAVEYERPEGKLPWIRVGSDILDLDEILRLNEMRPRR